MTAFLLGAAWMSLVGVQTRLLVKSSSESVLFGWVLVTSLIWGFVVREVILDRWAIVPYAVGTACGALLARRVRRKWL